MLSSSTQNGMEPAGPRGSFIIPHEFDWHLLIGDETAIPAIARRLFELPARKQVLVVIKTRKPTARIDFDTSCDLTIEWVLEAPPNEPESNTLEQAIRSLALPDGEGYVWAAGEYSDIKRIREYLVNDRAFDKTRIRASSYWRKSEAATHVHFD